MSILITGAGGFVGKRLVASLAGAGHSVVAVVRAAPSGEDCRYFSGRNVRIVVADLSDLDVSILPNGISAVVALAQSAHFREFPERATEVFDVNVNANLRLLDWSVRSGVKRFVLASSGGIYGGKLGAQFQETDNFPVNSPLGFYLGSKLCSEIVFQNYRQFFVCAVIIRPFFIYGPGQRADMFVTRIIHSVRDGRPVTLQGADGLKINPIYVDDAVTAFSRAVDMTGGGIVNIAGPDILSLRDVADMAGEYLDKAPVFEMVEGSPVDYVADISVARQILDLRPRSFRSGLAETLGR